VQHLFKLGHRRICYVTRPSRRLPKPGLPERAFLVELENLGIKTGAYNLPNWNGESETLPNLVDSMLSITPPTAILIDEANIFFSVQHQLARRGVLAPEHISLICMDKDVYFEVQQPTISHIDWDSRPWVRRVVQWVNGFQHGKDDRRQSLTKTEFIPAGTIGKAPFG
jgi:DNA-binding LacI/PurR family transcriptional regulator